MAIEEAVKKGEKPAPPTTLQELFEVRAVASLLEIVFLSILQEIHILIFVVMVMYICEAGRHHILESYASLRQPSSSLSVVSQSAGSSTSTGR